MKHAIELVTGACGALWLAAIAVELCFVAGLLDMPWLIGAIVAQIAAFLIASALLLVSNTRRPAGIDPNAPAPPAPPANHQRADPFGETTHSLLRAKVNLSDGMPYGARQSDDTSVVRRLAAHFESEDSNRPHPKGGAPEWALDLAPTDELRNIMRDVDTGLEIPPRDEEESL